MPRTMWVHSGGGRQPIRLQGVPDEAIVQDVKELMEQTVTGKAMGFSAGDWGVFHTNDARERVGAFLPVDQPVAPAGAESVLHLWVERVVSLAAGSPAGGGALAAGGGE